mgnify:FL=1
MPLFLITHRAPKIIITTEITEAKIAEKKTELAFSPEIAGGELKRTSPKLCCTPLSNEKKTSLNKQ